MSHYTVAVFTKTGTEEELEHLLAPFDEELEIEPHIYKTKTDLIENEKEYQQKILKQFADGDYDLYNLRVMFEPENARYFHDLLSAETDEDFYNLAIEDYDEGDIDDEGNILTTYNEDAKWDWYSVGGRWSGSLRDKNNHCWCDSVKAADWQWDACDEEHPQFNGTYAVLTSDGQWIAPGEMGWFGCSSESEAEYEEWMKYWKTRFYDNINPDRYVTIVDCHI